MTTLVEIKIKVPITTILKYYGCTDNGPRNNWGCNRHNSINKTSISITGDQVCCCVSPGCDLKGDIFSIIALYENWDIKYDFKNIVEKACSIGGITYTYDKIDPGDIAKLIKQDVIKESNKIFFEETKKYLTTVKSYIKKKRNITNEDISKLDLGFLPKEKYTEIKNIILNKLPQVKDIMRFYKDTNEIKYFINTYYAFADRIIHPHFYNKDILYFTGEVTPISSKNSKNKSKYIKMNADFSVYENGEGYLLDSLNSKEKDNIIIAEGYWDALKLKLLGFDTITFGTCKISQYFIDQYSHRLRPFKKVITCFDTESNQSGLKGAIAFNKKLFNLGIKNIYISELPEQNGNKIDIDDFIKSIDDKHKKDIYDLVICKGLKFYNYMLRSIKDASEDDKDEIVSELLEVYDNFPIRDKMNIEKELAKIFDFNKNEIKSYTKNIIKNNKNKEVAKEFDKDKNKDNNTEEVYLSKYEDYSIKLWEENPYFYDNNKIFWIWDVENTKWKMTDETNIFILLKELIKPEDDITINGVKNNIINAFKLTGRSRLPKDPPKRLIQFKDKLYNIKTNKITDITPEYFFLNPIPYGIGACSDTPIIDKLFIDWVGSEFKDMLYEIMAYCLYRGMPIQSLFCFVGSGANGKSKYLQLVRKYLGGYNTTSSTLNLLTGGGNSKFETSKIYRKLACFISETDYMEQKETTQIKVLTGDDVLTYEFKGKNPFSDYNYTKLLIATNSIPVSKDRTSGFYRRWEIINFPNTFNGSKDVLAEISDTEYENLSYRLIESLKNLLKRGHFITNFSIEQKKSMYIEYSDPLISFIKEKCKVGADLRIPLFNLYDKFITYLLASGKRTISKKEFGAKMRDQGYEIQRINKILKDGKRSVWQYINNIDLKEEIKPFIDINIEMLEDLLVEENKFRLFRK